MKYDIILLKCSGVIINLFMQELQKGVFISSCEGKTLYSFLTERCGISAEYIAEKIKTILIDGKPVDDIFNTTIKDGEVCALSGAMPGIVGAMMRIGSPYAAMRESITLRPGDSVESGKEINFGLKLFNVILSDLGPDFLKRGILIEQKRAVELFRRHGDEIYSNCSEISINGSLVDRQFAYGGGMNSLSGLVILKVGIENESKS
jgi:hypothetical protein